MHVTGAKQCIFGWLLRAEADNGEFVPAWLEPKWVVIFRDDEMIEQLIEVAQRFMTDFTNYKEMQNG
jgi:hypothetical protein